MNQEKSTMSYQERKRFEEEKLRTMREQEVAKILLMDAKQRMEIADQCLQDQNEKQEEAPGRSSSGQINRLAVDSHNPQVREVTYKFGEHSLAYTRVQDEIIRREGEASRLGIRSRVWEGTIHHLNKWKSPIVWMRIDPEDPYYINITNQQKKEAYKKCIKDVNEFFKSLNFNGIFIDLNGNPFEHYYKKTEDKN